MKSRKYRIVYHTADKVYVSILFYSHTNEFWNDLQHDLIDLGIRNATVFFDYVVQNGRNNRILLGSIVNNILHEGMTLVEDSSMVASVIKIFNDFFKMHTHYIIKSQLPTREKTFILNMLGV